MRKFIIILLLFLSGLLLAEDVPQGIRELVDIYKAALDEKSTAPLDGRLAKEFDYSGAGPEYSLMVLEQVIGMGVYTIGEIKEITVEKVDEITRVSITANITAMGNKEQESIDIIDVIEEDGVWKISALGVGVAQPMIIHDPTTDLEFSLEGPPRTILQFSPEYEHIIIEVTLADSFTANFVIDNGTPISVIDTKYADLFSKDTPMAAAAQAMGVSGDIGNTGAVVVDYLKIQELEIRNLTAITMDISHLSEALGIECVGLLGTEFLSKFAWTIDYSGHKLILHRLDEGGMISSDDPNDPITTVEPTHIIGFDRTLHLLYTVASLTPAITANVVLDCGAGGGVLVPEIFEKLPDDCYETGESDTLMGADKEKKVVESFIPKNLEIGPIAHSDYLMVVSDLSHINTSGIPTKIDAIIGYNFFSDWLITTWFNKDVVELRPIPK